MSVALALALVAMLGYTYKETPARYLPNLFIYLLSGVPNL